MRVAVLGAGIVGLTTAYQLVRRGHEVSIIDRQPGPALECSHANGGYIAISQAVPWSAPGVPTKTLLSDDDMYEIRRRRRPMPGWRRAMSNAQ